MTLFVLQEEREKIGRRKEEEEEMPKREKSPTTKL